MGGKFFKSVLIVLILIGLATIVSGCPWDSDDEPSKITPLDKPTDRPDPDDITAKPKPTFNDYNPSPKKS